MAVQVSNSFNAVQQVQICIIMIPWHNKQLCQTDLLAQLLQPGLQLLQADAGLVQLSMAAVEGQAQCLEGHPKEVTRGVQKA